MADQGFALRQLLLADLRRERWGPGERLPTERQLCVDHGMGRAAVRRALAEIKQLGLIRQVVGSGTYAVQTPPAPARGDVFSPAMLMEARLAMEPSLVPLIIRNSTAADLSALQDCCERTDQADTLEAFEQADGEFHLLLARATHNGFLVEMAEQMALARTGAEWGGLKRRSATVERRLLYGRQHRTLLGFLREREAAAAGEALLAHLQDVERNMFQ